MNSEIQKPVIILVSPKGEANLGGLARLMANFALDELRIVSPRLDLYHGQVKARALEAFPIVERAKIFDSLQEAQADLSFSAAYTMRFAGDHPAGERLTSLAPDFYFRSEKWGLVFGREDNGLEAEELRYCNYQIQIPSDEGFPSINITSAAAIALFDWYSKTSQRSTASGIPKNHFRRPLQSEVEIFFDQTRALLTEVGFIKHPMTDHIIRDLRDIYHRAECSDRDLRILFGIIADLRRVLREKDHRISNA